MFAQDSKWLGQRRFTLRHLRDFGFGKSSMENVVHEEITELLKNLGKLAEKGEAIQLNDVFGPAVINVLWVIVSGKRWDRDPEF